MPSTDYVIKLYHRETVVREGYLTIEDAKRLLDDVEWEYDDTDDVDELAEHIRDVIAEYGTEVLDTV